MTCARCNDYLETPGVCECGRILVVVSPAAVALVDAQRCGCGEFIPGAEAVLRWLAEEMERAELQASQQPLDQQEATRDRLQAVAARGALGWFFGVCVRCQDAAVGALVALGGRHG